MKLIKTELKFNVLAFQSLHNHTTLFSGLNSPYVYLWDYDKENFVSKIEGKNAFITCMTIGGENLLTGGKAKDLGHFQHVFVYVFKACQGVGINQRKDDQK